MSGKYIPPNLRNKETESTSSGQSIGYGSDSSQRSRGEFRQDRGRGGFRRPRGNNNRSTHFENGSGHGFGGGNGPLARASSMPAGHIEAQYTDEVLQQMFDRNIEKSDMSVYEGAQVTVHGDAGIEPITRFVGSGIDNSILYNIASIGYKNPTSVQKYAIPYVLSEEDLIVTAQTGSGKTAAFMLPVITMIMRNRRTRDPQICALVPTRELAIQIVNETEKFCGRSGIKVVCVFGGCPIGNQLSQLRYGCDILIATPGRLIDIMERRALTLSHIKYLILDEADRMLDMGFKPQIEQIIDGFDMPSPDYRQTLLFSATFPHEVQELASKFMRESVQRIAVGIQDAPSLIEQRFRYVPDSRKFSELLNVINDIDGQTLVFAERKVTVNRIEDYLYDEGCAVVAIHGDRDMDDRMAALRGFTIGRAKIMVATDVAARGLDIPNVAHVINVDLPGDLDTYTHRIGRTGRAGKRGVATSFWNEGNGSFLSSFIAHLRSSRMAIPEGLESFQSDTGRSGRMPVGGGRRSNSMYQ